MTETSPKAAKWDDVLRETQACAGMWHPDARIVGNVRAEDIRVAIRDAFRAIDELSRACGFPIVEDKPQVMETIAKRIRRLQEDKEKLQAAQQALRDIVCTEGDDRGVVLVDHESRTHYDPELKCHVYEHDNFSPLGDALIGLWEIITGESNCVGVEGRPTGSESP